MTTYQYKEDPYSSHSVVLRSVPDGSTVLDVGCSSGFLAQRLRQRGCFVTGIDNDKDIASAAKATCDEFILSDVNRAPRLRRTYDVILFADVLEHLADPERTLRDFIKYLKKNGVVVISVPNVANVAMRVSLFLGRFEYTEMGILDKTHLRFFTRTSLTHLIERTGLAVARIVPTPAPLPLVHPIFGKGRPLYFLYTLNYALTRIFPRLLGYQFVVVTRPHDATR